MGLSWSTFITRFASRSITRRMVNDLQQSCGCGFLFDMKLCQQLHMQSQRYLFPHFQVLSLHHICERLQGADSIYCMLLCVTIFFQIIFFGRVTLSDRKCLCYLRLGHNSGSNGLTALCLVGGTDEVSDISSLCQSAGQCQQLIQGLLNLIYAVVAAAPTATDGVGRLLPGQGVLTFCLPCHEESFWSARSNPCLPLLILCGQNQWLITWKGLGRRWSLD